MKKLQNCEVQNCIPTPSGCVEWNGGDIDYLGICNGESLNKLVWEIVTKLQSITGEDLSSFDLDSLLDVCSTKSPGDVTLLNILNVVKANQLCFKDYITSLEKAIAAVTDNSVVNVDLKCYQEFDNLGNSLKITRDQLDQLVVNELCSNKTAIEGLNGLFTTLKQELENFINQPVEVAEQICTTCVDNAQKPVSQQVIAVGKELCDLEDALGKSGDIQNALSKIPSTWNNDFGALPGWNNAPVDLADTFGNALLVIGSLTARVSFMEQNCCALTCDDIALGFTAALSDDGGSIVIKFTWGAGTKIPAGVVDKGSVGTLTDTYGNVETFNLIITNNAEIDIPLNGLSKDGDIKINVTAKVGTDALICQKCLNKTVSVSSGCATCEIAATGDADATVTIVYESDTIVAPTSSITG